MKRARGFTIIELLITLTIMVILLSLAVVNIKSGLAHSRDDKRKTDIGNIARGLEQRYTNGNPVITATTPAGIVQAGTYPGLREMLHALGNEINGGGYVYTPTKVDGGYMTDELPGVSQATLTPPNSGGYFGLICLSSCGAAGQAAQVAAAFNQSGSTYKDAYIYEPVDQNGNICWDNTCVRYNLYWISELDPTPYLGIPGLKVVESKHQ